MEIFVEVLNHPMYLVSSKGRVWSKRQKRFLHPFPAKRGFLQCSLDKRNYTLHRIMAESFEGEKVGKVLFKNGNRADCILENLWWGKDMYPLYLKPKPKTYILKDGEFKEES